jgi:aminoglycoside phosphotransferase (APT) family kinase protein
VSDLPGLDLDALTRWLDAAAPGLRTGPLAASMITGGKSNLTYRITDGESTWALRRPPLGHVLPTAHDMQREFRVISALAPIGIPVPTPVLMSTDTAILGVPFYLMKFVDGVVVDSPESVAAVDPATARQLGEALVDSLVELHSVDAGAVGLGDFGRPEGFLARQVSRWDKQWQSSVTRPLPVEAKVVALLAQAVPVSGAASIVHGDYRLSNVIYTPAMDAVAAIVDWEMATLGDPLADVGLLYVYHQLATTSDTIMARMSAERGFLAPDELVVRYAQLSGRDVSELAWYIAFGSFKLAVIAEGIAARYLQGKTVGAGFEEMGAIVPTLLDSAFTLLSK